MELTSSWQGNKACCFAGHRKLPAEEMKNIVTRLNCEISRLIELGVNTFYSGGALGFDQIAASLIIYKKEEAQDIKLFLALPHKKQEEFWTVEQKVFYRNMLKKADDITYVSDEYDKGCLKRRNYYLVEHSNYCICALFRKRSGTFQTVNYAEKRGLEVINIAQNQSFSKIY